MAPEGAARVDEEAGAGPFSDMERTKPLMRCRCIHMRMVSGAGRIPPCYGRREITS